MPENCYKYRRMNTLTRTITLFISQGAFSGRFPVAPGTAGTLAGVLLYWCMKGLPPVWYGVLLLLIVLIGTWSAGRAEVLLGRKDSPSIVIDEIAGYLVAMFLVPTGSWYAAAGFLLFRAFDIIKPYPLKTFEKAPGGVGVMLDDIGAGIYTNLVLQLVHVVIQK
jgi:phosphatidylglycerophosphatase A